MTSEEKPRSETVDAQALRIVQSLPIPNEFVGRVAQELEAGYTEEEIVKCVLFGAWPSSMDRWLAGLRPPQAQSG